MSEADPTLTELIRRALDSRLADVHVSMPGVVVSYDATTKTATVRPGLRRVMFTADDDRAEEEIPPLQNVPVAFPGSSKLTVHFRLEPGDTGQLVFSTNSISEWRNSGDVATPGALRLHDLGSAVFYPGLRSRKNLPPETDESIGIPGGLRLAFTEAAIKAGAGGDFVALASLVMAELNALKGYIASAAATEAGASGLGGMTALNSAIATAWPSPTGVASSNLKADP